MNQQNPNVPQPPEGVGGPGEPGWPDQQLPAAAHEVPAPSGNLPPPPGAPQYTGQPVDPGYAAYQPGPPVGAPVRRSRAGLVWGIILTVLGGFGVLGQVARLSNPSLSRMDEQITSGAEQFGYTGAVVLTVAILAVGIWLIVRSRKR